MSIRVGIVGISGFGGGEALRLVASHPSFELVYAAGESPQAATTTSLIAHIFTEGQLDPTVITGGIIQSWGSNARLGQSPWMIVEADESIVLDQGRIAERGTHARLLKKRGLYARMWSRQQEAEEARRRLAEEQDLASPVPQ